MLEKIRVRERQTVSVTVVTRKGGMPKTVSLECPFRKVVPTGEWMRNQMEVLETCQTFGEWIDKGPCQPKDCFHCQKCVRAMTKLLPDMPEIVVECPFGEVQLDPDWIRTQVCIVRHCENLEQWQEQAICSPRKSIHCDLCFKSLRKTTDKGTPEELLERPMLVNVCRAK